MFSNSISVRLVQINFLNDDAEKKIQFKVMKLSTQHDVNADH